MRILVVGAGIAGLTFVRALRYLSQMSGYNNFSIDIVERSPEVKGGTGIVIHPNGLRIIDAIGLSESFKSLAKSIETIKITQGVNNYFVNLHDIWGVGEVTRTILRNDLHSLLSQDIIKSNRIKVEMRFGYSITNILQRGSTVNVRFENDDTVAYDLVIGADGVHSHVRALLFPNTPAISTNLLYFRFVTKNIIRHDERIWHVFEREEESYGLIPLSENRLHCFVQIPATKYPFLNGEEESYFRKSLTKWDPLLSIALQERCGPLHVGFAYMVPPYYWNRGNCILLGDSAHAVSPTLSEGGALAMEDALTLSLAIFGSSSIEQAIIFYNSARTERCKWAYKMALFQLNSIYKCRTNNPRRERDTSPAVRTSLMAAIYKKFMDDPLPRYLREVLISMTTKAKSNEFSNDNQIR